MSLLGLLFHLQEQSGEPFEINLLLPLMGFIFCGVPLLLLFLIVIFFIRYVRKRKEKLTRLAGEQERQAGESKDDPTDHNA